MRRFRLIAAAAAALVSAHGTGLAADYGYRAPTIEPASVVPEEIGTGWYLRGDVGYTLQNPPAMSWQQTTETDVGARETSTLGIGVGYKFNEWVRADVTLDYLNKFRIKGTVSDTESDSLNVAALTVMGNVYADLGNYGGVTPYVGVGIGVASLELDSLTRSEVAPPDYTFGAASQLSFAASAAAGLTFDLGHGIQSDIGYRLLWINRAHTGAETTSALAGNVNMSDILSQQVRVGLRYYMN